MRKTLSKITEFYEAFTGRYTNNQRTEDSVLLDQAKRTYRARTNTAKVGLALSLIAGACEGLSGKKVGLTELVTTFVAAGSLSYLLRKTTSERFSGINYSTFTRYFNTKGQTH